MGNKSIVNVPSVYQNDILLSFMKCDYAIVSHNIKLTFTKYGINR